MQLPRTLREAGQSEKFLSESLMKFLSIETSTKYSIVAVCDEKGLLFGTSRLSEKGRLDGIDLLIREALKKTKLDIGDINGFSIGVGPGSFTGIRIGISALKGLSYAFKKPVYSFSSLDAIAYNLKGCEIKRLCVIVDARRMNLYSRLYEIGNRVKPLNKDELVNFESLFSLCRVGTVFCGDGAYIYKDQIIKKFGASSVKPQKFWFPTPESISVLTLEAYRHNKMQNCFELSANYLYGQDCQIRRKC